MVSSPSLSLSPRRRPSFALAATVCCCCCLSMFPATVVAQWSPSYVRIDQPGVILRGIPFELTFHLTTLDPYQAYWPERLEYTVYQVPPVNQDSPYIGTSEASCDVPHLVRARI